MTRERFIELVTAEQEPLRRFLLSLCRGNRDEAEEIAQETLIKAYLASGGYVERYKFSTWLFKIAYRTLQTRLFATKPCITPSDNCPSAAVPPYCSTTLRATA